MNLSHIRRAVLAAACGAWLCAPAHAADWQPNGVFVQGGAGEHIRAVTVGALWPWDWRHVERGEWTATTEVFASRWQADAFGGGHAGFTQVGISPMLRMRFTQGRSPWFVEVGIGLTLLDKDYRTPHRDFSTRFNFIDTLGVGRSFGERWQHELSLRYTHISNADIKKPNPGEDLLQLRYTARF